MTADRFDPYAVHSVRETPGANAVEGRVIWDPIHSLWNGGMMVGAVVFCPLLFDWAAVAVFVLATGAGLLLGHSVGFHRLMIHRSFRCPLWLDHVLIWCGTVVGMSGPFWMARTHDLRDWAQRQPHCHPYLRHGRGMVVDAVWQMHCRLVLERPPEQVLPERMTRDRFYRFLERTWMLQQLPLAVGLWLIGGWSFVVWGICARVSVSVIGHWFIGYLAHNRGPQTWLVEGAGVQAFDVPWAAIPTMGEAWHNNHHAWPGSARIGLYPEQADWGFVFIRLLKRVGLAWDVMTPETLPERACLRAVETSLP